MTHYEKGVEYFNSTSVNDIIKESDGTYKISCGAVAPTPPPKKSDALAGFNVINVLNKILEGIYWSFLRF